MEKEIDIVLIEIDSDGDVCLQTSLYPISTYYDEVDGTLFANIIIRYVHPENVSATRFVHSL